MIIEQISDKHLNENKKETTSEENQESFNSKKIQYSLTFVLILTLNASLVHFFIGWSFGVFDTIQVNIKEIYDWTQKEEKFYLSFISSAIPIGAFFGCLISGNIVAKIGRRYSFILLDIFGIVGIGITLFLNEYLMILGRFICGLCVGGFSTVVSLYVSEYVPYDISGACGAIYEFFFCLGIFSSFLFGLGLPKVQDSQNNWWRIMIAFPGIFLFINMALLLVYFRLDTPKFIYTQTRDINKVKICLKQIYMKEEDCEEMINDYEKDYQKTIKKVGLKSLLGPKYRFRLFISVIIMIAQQTSGIDALLMYADELFLKNVASKKTATFYTNLIGLTQVLSGFTAIFVIEKLGRKKLLLLGLLFITACLIFIATFYYFKLFFPVIYFFIFFTFCNGVSTSPVCFIYASDILPEIGVSLSISFNYLASFMVTETFLFLQNSFLGISGTICIYASCSLIALLICSIGMKETRGFSSVQIDNIFENQDPLLNSKIYNSVDSTNIYT
jgi:MFS family permease